MESHKFIIATGTKHFQHHNHRITSLIAECNTPDQAFIPIKHGAFTNTCGQYHCIAANNCAIARNPPHLTTEPQPTVIDNEMDWRRTSLSETDIPGKLLNFHMVLRLSMVLKYW